MTLPPLDDFGHAYELLWDSSWERPNAHSTGRFRAGETRRGRPPAPAGVPVV